MSDQSADYIRGYKEGFAEGWDAAKETFSGLIKTLVSQSRPTSYKFEVGCQVCGIGTNGEPLGYACQHPLCPTKFSSASLLEYNYSNNIDEKNYTFSHLNVMDNTATSNTSTTNPEI